MVDNVRVRREFVTLSTSGLAVHGVAWTIVFLTWLYPMQMSHWPQAFGQATGLQGMIAAPGITPIAGLDALLIAVGMVAVFLIASPNRSSIRTGGILLMLAAIATVPTAWGFLLGSALMLLAGVGSLGQLVTDTRSTSRPPLSAAENE